VGGERVKGRRGGEGGWVKRVKRREKGNGVEKERVEVRII
jgi:hypothetical protein